MTRIADSKFYLEQTIFTFRAKKGHSWSKKENVNITLKFTTLELAYMLKFILNKLIHFSLNLPGKDRKNLVYCK